MGEGGDTRWRVLGSLIFSEGVLALPLEPCAGITFRQIVVEFRVGHHSLCLVMTTGFDTITLPIISARGLSSVG